MLFDWFRRKPRQDKPELEWWQRLARVEHDMEQLKLGWEETYGKVRRALATLAKRQARELGEEAEANNVKTASGHSETAGPALSVSARDYAEARTAGLIGRRPR